MRDSAAVNRHFIVSIVAGDNIFSRKMYSKGFFNDIIIVTSTILDICKWKLASVGDEKKVPEEEKRECLRVC